MGQGKRAEALSLLSPAVTELERLHTPAEDIEPFRKALRQAQTVP